MKQLAPYFKGYHWQLVLGPAFKLAEAVLELFVPLIMADIIDVGIRGGDTRYILTRGLFMLGLGAIGLACAMVCQYFAAVCAQGFGRSLRRGLFHHIYALSGSEVDALGADALITRLTSDVNQVQTGVNMAIRLAIRAPFLAIGSVVMAFTINAKAALIFLVSTPLIILVLYVVMRLSVPFYREIQKKQDVLAGLAGENLSGVRVIRAFSRQQSETRQFEQAGEDWTRLTVRVGRISAALNPITSVLVNLAIVGLLWAGARFADAGVLAQGQIIALVNYMNQTLLALIVLANLIVIFTKAAASAGRVTEVLQSTSSLPDVPAEKEAPRRRNAPRIEFSNVSFGYHATADRALEHISFAVQPGQTLGVIGGTGCGKTTLANLLLRRYDATSGTVRVDGADVREIPLSALRARMGIVPQTAFLFSGTLRSNLQLGGPQADDTQLWHALETAQAAAFVREKPEGLDAPVEEGGKNFSGGQKQRLTIARALAARPDILILDDSASALDYATDAALRRALKSDLADCTVLMISQRASTLRGADAILVLDDGEAVGLGTHETLLKTCEVYREICRSQDLLGEETAR